jgi:propionate catabolism operon transcriptional regulator
VSILRGAPYPILTAILTAAMHYTAGMRQPASSSPSSSAAVPSGKPVIWTVSVSRLSELFRDITLEYDHLAHIEPLHLGFDEAARHIRDRLTREHCDVIVAAGSNAAYLRGRVPVPLVVAKASGFDVMQALARARRLSPRVGIVHYQKALPELAEFAQTFGVDVAQRTYVTREDARAAIEDLKATGIEAVVGAGLITDLAAEAGLKAVFVYSAGSIRQAFDDALEMARLTRLEADRGYTGTRTASPAARRPARGLADLRGESAAMERLRQSVLLYARSPSTVLIEGETGTGKELAARAIHQEHPRRAGGRRDAAHPFVAVNCGALAESLLESELFGHEEFAFTGARRGGHAGLFEAAHGGTLFLDEIGEMPLALQTRLLRVLEEREVVRVGGTRPVPVEVRIVAATHCDLAQRVREGRFRADLYYRLAVLRLALPPLRERRTDILPLAEWALAAALTALGVPRARRPSGLDACAALLEAHAWPGNVRELRNLMERLALFLAAEPQGSLTPALLLAVAPELGADVAPPLPAAGQESAAAVLARFGGQRDAAARHLGISRTTLWRRLKMGT